MSSILNIKRKNLNFSGFSNIKEVDEIEELQTIEKASVYVDNSTNRKLGRVGQPYKKGNKQKGDSEGEAFEERFGSVIDNYTTTLKDASGERLNAIIDYAELEIPKTDSDDLKRKKIAAAYYKSANMKELKSSKEIGEALDEIVEDALADYVPKKINISKILSKSKTLGEAKGKRLDAILKYAEIEIPKDSSDEEKRNLIAESYIKSAELEGSEEEIANSLDEIVEDALSDYSPKKDEKSEKLEEDKRKKAAFKHLIYNKGSDTALYVDGLGRRQTFTFNEEKGDWENKDKNVSGSTYVS